MTLFPFFENIDGKRFLVIGGGNVAKGKVDRLRQFTDNITVIAECTDIEGAIIKPFEAADLEGADYVIGASDDRELNHYISKLCRSRGVPVNIVDNPELCTFIFPSLVKRGDLVIGITSAGKSPAFSQYIRREAERIVPDNAEEIIDELYAFRNELKKTVSDQKERAKLLKEKLNELL